MSKYRSLLLRSNRLLGAGLVDRNLIPIPDLEEANDRLLEYLKNTGITQHTSVLSILTKEMNSLSEEAVIRHTVEETGIGIADLRFLHLEDKILAQVDPDLSWATWTVLFEEEEGFFYLATAYYLSDAVKQFWENQLGDRILWFAVGMDSILEIVKQGADFKLKRPHAAATT